MLKRLAIVMVLVVLVSGVSVFVVSAQGPGHDGDQPGHHGMMGQGMMGQGHHGMMGQGMMGQGMMGQNGMMGQGMMGGQTMIDDVAAALNLEPAALTEALQSGQTISEIAAEQGLEPQALADTILELRTAHMAQLVEDGSMTQEQMDSMTTYMSENLVDHLDFMFTGAGHGMMWGGDCPFFEAMHD